MRPSCSVMEQKEQPPKQPRMMLIEKRIISYAGMRALPYAGCGTRLYGSAKTLSISSVESGIAGGLIQIKRSPCFCINARAQPGLVSWCKIRDAWA